MGDLTKREQREEKRVIKKAGVKRMRRALKRSLLVDPEEAPDAEADFGPYRSAPLNGNDRDATRRKPGRSRIDG